MDQIIPGADKDIVTPLLQADLEALRGDPPQGQGDEGRGRPGRARRCSFEGGNAPATALFDKILVAVGRRPNGKLIGGGERRASPSTSAASSRSTSRCAPTCRTSSRSATSSASRCWPTRRCTRARSRPRRRAGKNAFFDAKVIPSVAYTDPEVAWVGLTENEAKAEGIKYGKGVFPWAASGPLAVARPRRGLHQGAVRRGARTAIIGGGIVGPHAGDLIAESGARDRDGCGRRPTSA